MHRRFFLIFTLISFLFGLALLSLPARSCGDTAASHEESCSSDVNICIACQLDTDIHHAHSPAIPTSKFVLHISDLLLLSPLERVFLLYRPPIA